MKNGEKRNLLSLLRPGGNNWITIKTIKTIITIQTQLPCGFQRLSFHGIRPFGSSVFQFSVFSPPPVYRNSQ